MQPRRLQLPFGSSCCCCCFCCCCCCTCRGQNANEPLATLSRCPLFPFPSPPSLHSMPLLTLDIGWGPCRDSGRSLLLDASFTFVRWGKGKPGDKGRVWGEQGQWSVVARDPHGMVNLRCQSLKLLRSIFVIRLTSILFSYLTLP